MMLFNLVRAALRDRVPEKRVASLVRAPVLRRSADSIVIPVVGEAYVAEARMAVRFALRSCPDLRELVVVSDLPRDAFGDLPSRVRVETLDVEPDLPAQHAFRQIFKSRLIKLRAPTFACGDYVLMTDSDLVLLRQPIFPVLDGAVCGAFRTGNMRTKLRRGRRYLKPSLLLRSVRMHRKYHLNGGFLAASRTTWSQLSQRWYDEFLRMWLALPDDQSPTDQIALCLALDSLGFASIDLGKSVNWSVPKAIGGGKHSIPDHVIGAHGGFPVSEWEKYLADPHAPLCFQGQGVTRKIRYLTDRERTEASDSERVNDE